MWGPGQGCIYGEESCQAHTSLHGMAPDITKELYGSVHGYYLPSKNFASGLPVVSGAMFCVFRLVSGVLHVPFSFPLTIQ